MSRRLIPRPDGAEERVLLECARRPAAPDPGPDWERVRDWERLLGLSEAHGMSPVLWRAILDAPANAVPTPVRGRVEASYRQNLRRNLALTARLVKILDLLRSEGIRAVLFKGPDLAERGYGDSGLRRYLDLDIIVAKDDALAAREVMLARGFRPERDLSPAWLRAQLHSQCDFKFFGAESGEAVEVHWDLTPRYFAFDTGVAGMLTRTVMLDLADVPVPVLAPGDVVNALCIHGMKHLWERLGWIQDLARWIDAHPDLVWTELLARAAERGLARVVAVGLLLAADLAPDSLSRAIRRRLRKDHVAENLARQLGSFLFGPPPSPVRAVRIQAAARERPGDALSYLARLAFTTTHRDWTTFPLSERMFVLRGAWRPVRLLLGSIPSRGRKKPTA